MRCTHGTFCSASSDRRTATPGHCAPGFTARSRDEGESFAELAKKYSEDKETNLIGGLLGPVELEQLDKNWLPTVTDLKEARSAAVPRFIAGTFGATMGTTSSSSASAPRHMP